MVYLPTFGYIRSEFCQNLIRSCVEKLWFQLTAKVCSWWTSQQREAAKWLAGSPTHDPIQCLELGSQWPMADWTFNPTCKSRKKHDGLFSEKPLAQCTDSLWNWGHEKNKSSARATWGKHSLPCCHCVTNPQCETCRNILYHHHCLSTCSLALQFFMLNVGKYTIHWVFGYGHYTCLLHFAAASLYRVFQDSLGSISIEDLAPQHCSVLGSAPGVFVSSKGTFIGGRTKRWPQKRRRSTKKHQNFTLICLE